MRLGLAGLGVAIALAAIAACGPSGAKLPRQDATPTPAWQLDYRLEGGAAGYDVSFQVSAGGRARYQRRRPEPVVVDRELGAEVSDELARLVHESGFLGLGGWRDRDPRPVANPHRYTLRWTEAGRVTEVAARDGSVLPEALLAVREAVGALQRRTLQTARPEPSSGPVADGEHR